jgi:signal transduction histidine kinase
MRFLVRSWEYRRPRLWVGVRFACGIFNVVIGVVLLASVQRLGPLAWLAAIPLAGAALIFWTVYRLQQDSIRRVRELEQSRAHLVDDSAARLRRIERDLHDGAQAQMVAVTMKLGLAVKKLGGMTDGTGQTDLDRVLELVVAAHRGAKEAIIELRDLARGIHPPVLDQGLGIALTTLAARSDLPVKLVLDLPERPSAAIETIAYFCAAELLANVTKHSGARRATLEAVHMPGLLRVRVSDDGCGGARVEARGGLAGLAERIRTVDGRLRLSSPPRGPSVITVELGGPSKSTSGTSSTNSAWPPQTPTTAGCSPFSATWSPDQPHRTYHSQMPGASFTFIGCCCWRSLVVDGSPGTSRGHESGLRRRGSRWDGAVERPSAFRPGISQVGADRASVMRCRRSP